MACRSSISFPLRLSGIPNGVLQYAAFVEAQPSEAGEVQVLGKYLFGQVSSPCSQGQRFALTALPGRTGHTTACPGCLHACNHVQYALDSKQDVEASGQDKS